MASHYQILDKHTITAIKYYDSLNFVITEFYCSTIIIIWWYGVWGHTVILISALKINKSLITSCNRCKYINVREYRRGNQKRTIQRNWQHRVHKTKKNKTKTQHNMCWTPLSANKHN